MSKRAAIYARVSTDMQRDNYSIPSQIAECVILARSHNYSIVGDRFVDPETGLDTISGNGALPAFVDDFSSREINRPGFNAVLDYLEQVGFDVLIVHAIDRLARDPYIRQTLEREVQNRGAKIEYAIGNYEETPEGEVRKDLDATFAKWENTRRVERSTRGKRKKAQAGLFVGGRTPLGYALNSTAPGGLEVIEEEARIVQHIFKLYVSDRMSVGQIVKEMDASSAITKLGRCKWQKSTVRFILTNSVYIGKAYYNKFKCKGNSDRDERPRDDWIEIKVTPLITEEEFRRAQELIDENRSGLRAQPRHTYLLNRMIRCTECERPYLANFRYPRPAKHRKAERSYKHRKVEGQCMNRSISANRLEPLVWQKIYEFLLEPRSLEEGYEKALELERANHSRQLLLHENLIRMVGKQETKLQNLISAYTDPDIQITKTEYLTQRAKIDEELRSIENQIDKVKAELSKLPTREEYADLERFAEDIRRRLDGDGWTPSIENKRKILELLHIKVWISVDYQIKITGWFGELEGLTYNVRLHFGPRVQKRAQIQAEFHLHRGQSSW